jgi:DNA-binding protein HU-beta
MNKVELVNYVAASLDISKKDAKEVVAATIEGITEGLLTDGKVSLVGFGTFSVVKRNARTARNPQTNETIEVPEKYVPKFKASSILKENVALVEGFDEGNGMSEEV